MYRRNGFSLVELMITVALAAIVLAAGLPSFRSLIQNNRITTQANTLVTSLNFARNEAIRSAGNVTVCPRNANGTACQNSGDWAEGWLVIDANGQVLRVTDALTGQTNFNTAPASVVYLPRGQAQSAVNFDIRIDGCSGDQRRLIGINSVGRVSVTRASCSG